MAIFFLFLFNLVSDKSEKNMTLAITNQIKSTSFAHAMDRSEHPAKKHMAEDSKDPKVMGFSAPALMGTLVGTLVPVLAIRHYQGKSLNLSKLPNGFIGKIKAIYESFGVDYGLKEMLLVANSAILTSFTAANIFGDKSKSNSRAKESIFQMLNTSIATTCVAGLLALTEKSKHFNNNISKIGCIFAGLAAGVPIALLSAKLINKQVFGKDEFSDRKIKVKDFMIHADDLVSACILANFPLVNKLPLDKLLAVIFGKVGYDCGNKND